MSRSRSARTETDVLNGVGYNIARLRSGEIDLNQYVNITRKLASEFVGYHKGFSENSRVKVLQIGGFRNHISQYALENQAFMHMYGRHQISGGRMHIALAKAHALFFLENGGCLDERVREIVEHLRNNDITQQEAIGLLDNRVFRYHKDQAEKYAGVR